MDWIKDSSYVYSDEYGWHLEIGSVYMRKRVMNHMLCEEPYAARGKSIWKMGKYFY